MANFDSFEIEYILQEVLSKIKGKSLMHNMSEIQGNYSIMCGFHCIFHRIWLQENLRLTGKYFLFRKVNNKLLYINAKSNHPYTIIKELPKIINKRLSELYCSQEEFSKAKPFYGETLSESNYKASLQSEKPRCNTDWIRLRKVIWFNPPFNQSV